MKKNSEFGVRNSELMEMFLKAADFRIIRMDPGFYCINMIGWRIRFRGNDYGSMCGCESEDDFDEWEQLLKEKAMDTILLLMSGSAQP